MVTQHVPIRFLKRENMVSMSNTMMNTCQTPLAWFTLPQRLAMPSSAPCMDSETGDLRYVLSPNAYHQLKIHCLSSLVDIFNKEACTSCPRLAIRFPMNYILC